MQRRLQEFIGQQSKAGNVRGPTQARRHERQQCDLEYIARLGSVDIHRAGDRIDLAEIHASHIGDARVLAQLTTRGIHHVEFQRLSRRYACRGSKTVVPAEMPVMNGVSMCWM